MNIRYAFAASAFLLLSMPASAQVISQSGSLSQSGSSVVMNSAAVQQAPGVGAPGLAAAGIETCTSSASSGVSGPGFGFSFGATDVDEGCEARLDARTLAGLGLAGAAVARLCERPKMAIAMAQSGQYICPQITWATPSGQSVPAPTAGQSVAIEPAVLTEIATKPTRRQYNPDTNTWE